MDRVRKQIEVPIENVQENAKGVTVAVLDTGIARHPDLAGKLLCFSDFVNGRKLMYDDNGHGTHVCGIICGSGAISHGRFGGIAPLSRLVVGKVLDAEGDGSVENMLAGLEWIIAIRERYNIRILNISVGIGMLNSAEKENALKKKIEEVWSRGIVVVCAAGNKGPKPGSISAVGGSEKVITVGCHDGIFCMHHPRCCESYSGRGAALSNMRKPDVVAPGTDIVSCNALYRNFGVGKEKIKKDNAKIDSAYIAKSGTSMATPIVTGAAALALQKYPNMSNTELRQKLTITATDLREPWNKQGWGMINVKRFLS